MNNVFSKRLVILRLKPRQPTKQGQKKRTVHHPYQNFGTGRRLWLHRCQPVVRADPQTGTNGAVPHMSTVCSRGWQRFAADGRPGVSSEPPGRLSRTRGAQQDLGKSKILSYPDSCIQPDMDVALPTSVSGSALSGTRSESSSRGRSFDCSD